MSPAKKTRKKKTQAGGAAQLDLLEVGGVVDVAIEDRMEQAFLDYAMSVIVGRALPDARDGLKPVQRRILYTMWETGLRPDRPYRKCASAVGEVMKKYHPHGDTAIYDALVRMAQDFSTRELLVDGHGNFGSIDGDPPAAMRYTEARLSLLAMELLDGIDEDTVEFVPNYDGYEREPVVLPARFPNLLVNGATGIAVGMATNIAPHNLGEVIAACLHLIDKPKATAQQLMRFVPAPDFPTGARIVESDGIRDAMIAGRGAVTLEAVASTEVRSGNLPRIVITEIPYQVNKANLLEKIAALVQKKEFEAIRDLRDESSRDGMRIVIELKRGEDPARVLERLYRKTDLRTNFNVNCVALVDGAPQTLGIKEALEIYLAHQREVLTRRTKHRLKRAEDRAHILEGLLHALDYLDEVIALIRGSDSAEDAKHGLISDFELSERQAQAVLDMQLRRLAALERAALEDEYQELLEVIEALQAILRSKARLDEVLREELTEIQRIHATPRRSVIVAPGEVTDDEILETGSDVVFEAQDVTVYVTQGAYVKVVPQRRTTPAHKHGHDPLVAVLRATTDHSILLIDRAGNGYRIDLADVPVQQPRHRGVSVNQLIGTGPDVPLAGAAVLYAGATVLTVSVAGQVKRTEAEVYLTRQRQIQAAGVKDGDEIEFVAAATDDDHLVAAHDQGLVTRFPLSEVRTMGRTASGVAAMKLPKGAKLVSATIVESGSDEGEIATIAGDGTGFRAPLSQYPVQGRGGKGVKAGPDRLLYCGVARDLHVHGDPPAVVRPVDLPAGKRNGKGTPLDADVGAPVIPEHA